METNVIETDAAAAAAGVPGLTFRPYAGEGDVPELVRVANAELEADGIDERRTVEDVAANLRHPSPGFDARRDLLVAEVDGEVVAHGRVDWVDTTDGLREYRTHGYVDPAWRRRGVGRALHRANVARLREIASEHDTDRPRWLGMWTNERSAGAMAIARSEAFEAVRWFFEMLRPRIDTEPPDLPPMPAGLEVRPVEPDRLWQLWQADVEAFQDHWGGFDASEENFTRWQKSPEFDPSLFVVAWDGDEIAGGVMNAINAAENSQLGVRRGWLDSVFTRRPWRRRGLARALIARSLHLLAERGMDTAMLGVDADNPSGALGLYEGFGFAVAERGIAWRKPMEAGS